MPLYAQIKTLLREEILRQYEPGKPFYSDEELAEHFGVNRLTVRQAVKELVDEGLLYRVRGVGTFITGKKVEGEPVYQQGFIRHWTHQGRSVTVEVRVLEPRPCPETVCTKLGLPSGSRVLYLERLRLVERAPAVLDYIYMPLDLAPHVTAEDFKQESLPSLLRRAGRKVTKANVEIEAVLARPPETDGLLIQPGEPLLLRRIALLAESGKPVTYGESYHRAALFKYSVQVPLSGTE